MRRVEGEGEGGTESSSSESKDESETKSDDSETPASTEEESSDGSSKVGEGEGEEAVTTQREWLSERLRTRMRERVREQMGLEDKDMLVLCLSSVNPGKGQLGLVSAALAVWRGDGEASGTFTIEGKKKKDSDSVSDSSSSSDSNDGSDSSVGSGGVLRGAGSRALLAEENAVGLTSRPIERELVDGDLELLNLFPSGASISQYNADTWHKGRRLLEAEEEGEEGKSKESSGGGDSNEGSTSEDSNEGSSSSEGGSGEAGEGGESKEEEKKVGRLVVLIGSMGGKSNKEEYIERIKTAIQLQMMKREVSSSQFNEGHSPDP